MSKQEEVGDVSFFLQAPARLECVNSIEVLTTLVTLSTENMSSSSLFRCFRSDAGSSDDNEHVWSNNSSESRYVPEAVTSYKYPNH